MAFLLRTAIAISVPLVFANGDWLEPHLFGYQTGWPAEDWNWGLWGHSKDLPPPKPPAGPLPHPPPHDFCPAPHPGFPSLTFPLQPMLSIQNGDKPESEYWESMCPRDLLKGQLYHPVQCPNDGPKGCCTWRATATQVNGNWACCPCGAVCTGAAPSWGYTWTQGSPVPTPSGWVVPPPVTVTLSPGAWLTPSKGPARCSYTTTVSDGTTRTILTTAPAHADPANGYNDGNADDGKIGNPPAGAGKIDDDPGKYVPCPPGGPMVWGDGSWVPAPATTAKLTTSAVTICSFVSGSSTSCQAQSTTSVSCGTNGSGSQTCSTTTRAVSATVVATGGPGRSVGGHSAWALLVAVLLNLAIRQ